MLKNAKLVLILLTNLLQVWKLQNLYKMFAFLISIFMQEKFNIYNLYMTKNEIAINDPLNNSLFLTLT